MCTTCTCNVRRGKLPLHVAPYALNSNKMKPSQATILLDMQVSILKPVHEVTNRISALLASQLFS